MAIDRTTLEEYQDDAIKTLYNIVVEAPEDELRVKSNAVRVQAAALLLNLEASVSPEEMREHFRRVLDENPAAARQLAEAVSLT